SEAILSELHYERKLRSMCSSSVLLVFSWCSPGVLLVFSWCSPGVLLVFSWCSPGVLLVFSWCSPGSLCDYSLTFETPQCPVFACLFITGPSGLHRP
ncbi:uncharacterized protein DAT39_019048, partial [Clarias magur]